MTTPPQTPAPPAPASAPASGAAPTAPATPAPAPAPGSSDGDRLAAVERGIAELRGLITGQRSTGQAPAAAPDIEAIARATMEQGKQEEAARDREAAAEGRLKKIEADLAKMRETKPRPPLSRLTRMMWPGHHDRD